MNVLRLSYRPADDWHGELYAFIDAFGFCGRSSAWFNRSELADFALRLAAHPLEDDAPVTLSGGVGFSGNGGPRRFTSHW